MKVALLVPGPSQLEQRIHGLLEGLRGVHEVELFGPGERPLAELRPKQHERLLLPIADEPLCAPLLQVLRNLGGTVWLTGWHLGALAHSYRPTLKTGGLAGRIARWREGGLAAVRDVAASPLNRSVVRIADAFVVAHEDLRAQILAERNAHTPIGIMGADDGAELGRLLAALPAHRTNRKSLIAAAIEMSDQARTARDAE